MAQLSHEQAEASSRARKSLDSRAQELERRLQEEAGRAAEAEAQVSGSV